MSKRFISFLFLFPFILDIKFVGRTSRVAGSHRKKGHTGFLIHLLSAVRALIFHARRIQPFLSLVDREVEFCVLTIQSFSTRWAFFILFLVSFSENGSNSRPNVSEGYKVPLSYRGDRLIDKTFIQVYTVHLLYQSPRRDTKQNRGFVFADYDPN